jgi:hypothetical protein
MTIALDLGASRLRSLRRRGERLIARSGRALYAVLPDSILRRRALEKIGVPFSVSKDTLILASDAAAEYSRLFQVPTLPLLPEGRVPTENPPARQILAALIEQLLPAPTQANEVCCLTLPGAKRALRFVAREEREFLSHVVELRGYRPLVLSAGRAIVLAELEDDTFTGIGMSFGAATSEVCLARHGMEIASCSVPIGGDWIDRALADADPQFAWDSAGARHIYLDEVTRWKENLSGSVLHPKTEREAFLADLYRDLIGQVLDETTNSLLTSPLALSLPHPVSLVCCGGTAKIRGFGNMLQQMLADAAFPLRVQRVRMVIDSDYTVARGCLIAAEIEEQAIRGERQAAA